MCCNRKEKQLLKAMETPEEKRARRLAKKVMKTEALWNLYMLNGMVEKQQACYSGTFT